ncbi:MAG: response regulator [Lachnospiraceae bacterium]|nr:response regulator [Lachnospiraceae bacterium]
MAVWIMIVDDDVTNLKMAGHILSKHNLRITALRSGKILLDYVRKNGNPDLILLDINMPEMDGFETYTKYRALEKELGIDAIPIVFLTADEDKTNESRGFEMGVSDYIRKPFDPDVLVRRVTNIINTRGQILKYEEEATVDKLTGFYNKYSASDRISKICLTGSGTLMIIDLDSFKLVDEIYGIETGDRVLSVFSKILRDNMPFACTFGRVEGDKFILFAEEMTDEKDLSAFSDAINSSLIEKARSIMGKDMSIPIGASIGAVLVPKHGTGFNELFRLCERALYVIKNNGKRGYFLYNEDSGESPIPSDINITELSNILEEKSSHQSAMWMGREAFSNVYRYMIRYMDRYRGTAYKMLFTARFIPTDLAESEKKKIMLSIRELLQESLRNSDIMMQIGDNHFFLMLPEISDYNVTRVTERVMEAWALNKYNGLVDLTVETASTESEIDTPVTESDKSGRCIVITDDDPAELDHFSQILSKDGFDVTTAKNEDELMQHLSDSIPGLLIIKADMHVSDGIGIMHKIKQQGGAVCRVPVIFITDGDPDTERKCLESGANELITPDISGEKLCLRAGNLMNLSLLNNYMNQEVEKKTEENEKLSIHIIKALAYAIDAKDKYTNGHSSRVAEYSKEIAARYGYDEKEQNEIYIIGLLHDVGKIGIPDAIINKNALLTDDEYSMIKLHPVIGTQILETITEMPNLSSGARWHHERYDGNGYPDRLAGDDIPEVARIIAVADAYDAMTSHRSYRDTLPQDKVRSEFIRCSGSQFDPKFADIMLKLIDEDPDYRMREK